jgi:hypothetical protein
MIRSITGPFRYNDCPHTVAYSQMISPKSPLF